ncbi:pentapeptide repeat-containing protein [Cohaesibacter marisflavi]|uniref:pentapeptide repeat-containing protein n=1 Tax=Cohaesibacter marisflavi TaxID=655353 RepID=UPI0029C7EEFB|nr:pentapeptide repeat-containing protein [Cohaesibacter marisflavi]
MTRSYILRKKKNMRSRASNRLKAQKVEIVEPTATILRKEVKRSTIWRIFEMAGIVAALAGLGIAIADNRVSQEGLRLAREENRQNQVLQSLQIISTNSPGSVGKKEALETLHKEGKSLSGIDLSCHKWGERKFMSDLAPYSAYQCLKGAQISFLELPNASVDDADFSGADLSESNFEGAQMKDINLVGANISYANFKGANLVYAKLNDVGRGTLVWGTNFVNANLASVDFTGARIIQASISHANLYLANFTGSYFGSIDFTGSNLQGIRTTNASWDVVILKNADLAGVNFSNFSELNILDLSGADLSGANLKNVNFRDVNISNTIFCHTEPYTIGVALNDFGIPACAKNLTQRQFEKAWAWKDQMPITDGSYGALGLSITKLCDPALRPEYEKSQKYGIPKGCQ